MMALVNRGMGMATATRARAFARSVIVACVLGLLSGPGRATGAPLDEFLAAPISPGSIGLLAAFRGDPRIPARLAEALTHAAPEVRRAAARVITVSGLTQLTDDARRALTRERDAETAVELMRAVVFNSTRERDAELIGVATPLGSAVTRRLAHILAWARGADALRHIEELARSEGGRYDTDFVETATRGGPALSRLASRAIADRNTELWRAAIAAVQWSERPLDLSLVRAGLTTSAPKFRAIVLWQVALDVMVPRQPELWAATRQSILAVAKETSGVVDRADGDARLAEVVLGRTLGDKAVEDQGIIALLDGSEPLMADRLLHSLDPRLKWPGRERRALERRAKRLGVTLPTDAADSKQVAVRPAVAVRTLSGLPTGYSADIMRVAACGQDWVGFRSAHVTYDSLGRVADLVTQPPGTAKPCDLAFQALVSSTLQTDPRLPRQQEQLVLPLQRDYLACLANTDVELPRPIGAPQWDASDVSQPHKTRDVRPIYPRDAIDARAHGTVYLSAVISSAGCVNDIRLETSIHPSINLSAIVALAGWRFEPAVLYGAPVPVRMTATVSFSLN